MGQWPSLDKDFQSASTNKFLEELLAERFQKGLIPPVLNVLVIGLRGNGKSTLINHLVACLAGEWVPISTESDTGESVTTEPRVISLIPHRMQCKKSAELRAKLPFVNIIDTPGLQSPTQNELTRIIRGSYGSIKTIVETTCADLRIPVPPLRDELDLVPHHVLIVTAAGAINTKEGQEFLTETRRVTTKGPELSQSVVVTKVDLNSDVNYWQDHHVLRCQRNSDSKTWKLVRSMYERTLVRNCALQCCVYIGYLGQVTRTGNHHLNYATARSSTDAGISDQTDPRIILGRWILKNAIIAAFNTSSYVHMISPRAK